MWTWAGFATLADEDLTVSFTSQLEPSDLFKTHMEKPEMSSSVLAYSMGSSGEVFLNSREVALQSLDGRTYDLQQATKDVFAAVLQGESQLPAPLRERITRHALALAMTSPEVFGPSFKLNTLARRGEFSLTPIAEFEQAHERYDIVQWIACYNLLGKAFDLEGWEPFWARSVVAGPAPKDVVVQVSLGNKEYYGCDKGGKRSNGPSYYYAAKQTSSLSTMPSKQEKRWH